MEAISLDLRRRVADALDAGTETISAIARRFEVSRRWVYQFIKLRQETGDIVPHSGKSGRPRKVTDRQVERIKARLVEKPDATLDELRRHCRTSGSVMAVFRVLKAENMTRKKKV